MKKKNLIILIIIACMLCILNSCENESSISSGNTITQENGSFKLIAPEDPLSIPPDERVDKWEEYMFGKYSIEIDLMYCSSNIDFDKLLEISDAEGLIVVDNYEMLNKLIQNDMIIPLNFYQDKLNNYKNINSGMIDSLTDSTGNLWAVPLRKGEPLINKRTYNKEWLDAIGVPVPETIDEFYDYAMYVAYSDPDGNGINDTYIAEYSDRNLFRTFSDVFKAFGCYPTASSSVAYNPLKLCVEDFVTTGNFIEAMEYIRAMNNQGLIINSETASHSYKVASSMDYWEPEYVAEKEYGFYLRGPNEKRLIEERYPEGGVAVLKHTKNPTKKLDALYKIIYSSPDSYMDLQIGIKDQDYFDMIDHYVVKSSANTAQEAAKFQIGIYTDLNRAALNVKPTIWSNSTASQITMQKHMDIVVESREANEAVERYLGTSLSYRLTFDIYNGDFVENGTFSSSKKLIFDILTNNIPIEDAVNDYIN